MENNFKKRRSELKENTEHNDFLLINTVNISNIGTLDLYQHPTGVFVAVMKTKNCSGPSFTHCRMSFTTTPSNNKGIPHALEHIIFNGSQKFPFNDSIDKISNRLCCPYTNAFTTDDSTSFEFESTNDQGLVLMLNVWLDHLFNPLFSEESFLTEIVHLDGNAEFHGVVYSEILSSENCYDEIVTTLSKFHVLSEGPKNPDKQTLRSTWELYDRLNEKYNGKKSGIFSCKGRTVGIESLQLKELQEFHSNYYKLNNMLIFIHGNEELKITSVFKVIEDFIDRTNSYRSKKNNKKSKFVGTCDFPGSVFNRMQSLNYRLEEQIYPWHLVVPFPSEDEDLGIISFSWRFGVFSDFKEMLSINVLLHYLCVGNDSPLTKELVEKNSYCSNVDLLNTCEKQRYHQIFLHGVEVGNFEKTITCFKKIILEFQNGRRKLNIDDLRCKMEGLYFGFKISLETETIDTVFQQLIGFLNYGAGLNIVEMNLYCNLHLYFEELFNESLNYWNKLFCEAFNLEKVNVIEFKPSKLLSRNIMKKLKLEKKRRSTQMGQEFLLYAKGRLEDAIRVNKERTVNTEILTGFDIKFDLNGLKLNKAKILTNIDYCKKESFEVNKDIISFKKLGNSVLYNKYCKNCLYFFLVNPNTDFLHIQLRFNLNENLLPIEKLLSSFIVELLFQTSVDIVNPNNPQIINEYLKLREIKSFLPEINWCDGEFINYDDYDKLLNTFCVEYYAEFGDGWIVDSNTVPNQIKISWTTPKEYVEFSSILIISGIIRMKMNLERVSTTARTLLGTISELKQNENDLITCISNLLCFSEKSMFNISNIPNVEYISRQLSKYPEKYLEKLKEIHLDFIRPFLSGNSGVEYKNTIFSLFVIGNEVSHNIGIFKYFCLPKNCINSTTNMKDTGTMDSNLLPWEVLPSALPLKLGIDFNRNESPNSRILEQHGNCIYLEIPSSSTACFAQSINLNTFGEYLPKGTHFYNPDIPPLLVLSSYLWDPCSLLFEAIRGKGLAYSGCLEICLSTGRISNCVYESTSISESLMITWEIFRELSFDESELTDYFKKHGKMPKHYERFYNSIDLSEAKRITAYDFISKHKKFITWAKQINFDLNIGISPSFDKFIIEKISKVEIEDIKRVSNKYLKHFLPSDSNNRYSSCIAFCGSSHFSDAIKKCLENFKNFKLSVVSFSDISKEALKNIDI
ncbi:Insulinase like metalloprotease [Cryptosporidium felis]|nr:Insulinase like metalloprotease [Cryptosporidium felis]